MQYGVGRQRMRRQRGIGLVGMLFALVTAGFFATIGMKLGPRYMEFLTVKSVMKDVAEDPEQANAGKMSVFKTIENRLYINSVRSIDPNAFSYKKTSSGFRISVDYNVQEHLFANVDVVLNFAHEVTANQP